MYSDPSMCAAVPRTYRFRSTPEVPRRTDPVQHASSFVSFPSRLSERFSPTESFPVEDRTPLPRGTSSTRPLKLPFCLVPPLFLPVDFRRFLRGPPPRLSPRLSLDVSVPAERVYLYVGVSEKAERD